VWETKAVVVDGRDVQSDSASRSGAAEVATKFVILERGGDWCVYVWWVWS
jgi:hypothetical protein